MIWGENSPFKETPIYRDDPKYTPGIDLEPSRRRSCEGLISAPWIRRGGRGRGDQGRCWPRAIKAPKALGGWATRGRTVFSRENRVFSWLCSVCFYSWKSAAGIFLLLFFCGFLVVFLKMVCFLLDDDFFTPAKIMVVRNPTGQKKRWPRTSRESS